MKIKSVFDIQIIIQFQNAEKINILFYKTSSKIFSFGDNQLFFCTI